MRLFNSVDSQAMSSSSAMFNNFVLLKNLNPYNPDVKRTYFALLPKIVAEAMDNYSLIDHCKELLYALSSNSELTLDERQLVQKLMNQLNGVRNQNCNFSPDSSSNRTENSSWCSIIGQKSRTPPPSTENWDWNSFTPANHYSAVADDQFKFSPLSTTFSAGSTPSKSANSNETVDSSSAAPWARCRRSLSLTNGPANHVGSGLEWSNGAGTPSPANQNDDVFSHMKTFRYHGDISPQNSISGGSGSTSSGENSESTSTIKKNTFVDPGSGMRDVPMWLKSLRLHKYSNLFAQLTYDEMMGLTEEQLDLQGVTKGARHKIVLSIQKLKDRPNLLKQLQKDLDDVGSLKTTLNELKLMIGTPIRACESSMTKTVDQQEIVDSIDEIGDGDIPSLMIRVLAQACMHLLTVSNVCVDEDCFNLALHLLDRCLNHEAFTAQQKKHCLMIKQQIRRIWNPSGMVRKLGPRSNSWNKDRRTCASAQQQQTISPVVGVQRPNAICSIRPIAMNRTSNGFTANFAANSQTKPVQIETNGVLYHHPTSMYQATVVQPANQQQNNRSLFSPLDLLADSYFAEGRNHIQVQRTISAPAFRLPAGQCQPQQGLRQQSANQQQQKNLVVGAPPTSQTNTSANMNPCCQNYFASPANQNGGGWCGDDVGSLLTTGYRRQTPQNSPFHNRSAWSCGFEESTSPAVGQQTAVSAGGAFVGPIGSCRPAAADGNSFMQISRGDAVARGCNQSVAASANFLPMTSSQAAGLTVNDIHVWNMDQLCRRVIEAAIDCDKSEVSGF